MSLLSHTFDIILTVSFSVRLKNKQLNYKYTQLQMTKIQSYIQILFLKLCERMEYYTGSDSFSKINYKVLMIKLFTRKMESNTFSSKWSSSTYSHWRKLNSFLFSFPVNNILVLGLGHLDICCLLKNTFLLPPNCIPLVFLVNENLKFIFQAHPPRLLLLILSEWHSHFKY